ncbi:hypothetical protein PoB_006576600 [Plakobranchus ocellatus]|uniref:Uncharacterized protein n=1 Tax=Plakobranchus ocellatus TaxID=259542 RepID=A0AAV4D596_9GAST|nr:hypothetical protein PoB_006576600 [Plakobranchus ocellatus]
MRLSESVCNIFILFDGFLSDSRSMPSCDRHNFFHHHYLTPLCWDTWTTDNSSAEVFSILSQPFQRLLLCIFGISSPPPTRISRQSSVKSYLSTRGSNRYHPSHPSAMSLLCYSRTLSYEVLKKMLLDYQRMSESFWRWNFALLEVSTEKYTDKWYLRFPITGS